MKNVLDEDIKKGEFSTVYLLYGEEEFLKQSYKKQLRSAIAGDDTIMSGFLETVQVLILWQVLLCFRETETKNQKRLYP